MSSPIIVQSIAHSAGQTPVAELATRLAEELAEAASLAEDCQEAMGQALGHDLRRDLAERLQRLDELTQRLADLSGVMTRLAEGADLGVAPAGVLDGLRLSALRDRLNGGPHGAAASGEAELW